MTGVKLLKEGRTEVENMQRLSKYNLNNARFVGLEFCVVEN